MITVRLTTEELDRFLSIAAFVDRKLPSPKKPLCTTNFQLLDVSPDKDTYKDSVATPDKPRIIPNIPIKDTDIFVYPIYGDRYDTMAQRYYEDSNLWWIIVKANDISDGKIAPDPLKKLRIPTEIDDILQSISQAN